MFMFHVSVSTSFGHVHLVIAMLLMKIVLETVLQRAYRRIIIK